jgi:hypothetical protein
VVVEHKVSEFTGEVTLFTRRSRHSDDPFAIDVLGSVSSKPHRCERSWDTWRNAIISSAGKWFLTLAARVLVLSLC